MEVSIIVPVYNSSLMLKELIERMHKTMSDLDFKNNFEKQKTSLKEHHLASMN